LTDERMPSENERHLGHLAHLHSLAVRHRVWHRFEPDSRIFKEALKFGRWISWNGVYDCLSRIGKVEIHLSRCVSNIQYLQLPRATSTYESQLLRSKLESPAGCRKNCSHSMTPILPQNCQVNPSH